MGDASRFCGVPPGGQEVRSRVICTTTIPYRFSPVRGSFCFQGFGILGSEAGLGTKLSGFRCALSKRVGFAEPRFSDSILSAVPTLDSLLLVVNRNLWLLIDSFYLDLKGINMG